MKIHRIGRCILQFERNFALTKYGSVFIAEDAMVAFGRLLRHGSGLAAERNLKIPHRSFSRIKKANGIHVTRGRVPNGRKIRWDTVHATRLDGWKNCIIVTKEKIAVSRLEGTAIFVEDSLLPKLKTLLSYTDRQTVMNLLSINHQQLWIVKRSLGVQLRPYRRRVVLTRTLPPGDGGPLLTEIAAILARDRNLSRSE